MFWRHRWNNDARARVEGLARTRPWDRAAPRAAQPALRLQGMLGVGESKLLFELARRCFTGRGTVVDAGSFLGKSASLFAAGLRANRHAPPAMKKVHCFDSFRVHESGTVKFIQDYFGREVAIGDSTREWFDRQTEPVRDVLEVHAGDFLAARWSAGPIELLLVDIAKSQALWSRVLAEMFPQLIPGLSLVVHQDYHHTWQPHIHVVMEFLQPCFELVIPRVDSSAVFLLKEAIPEAMLARAIHYDFTAQEREALMDAAIARIPLEQRLFVRAARACMLLRDRGTPDLLEEIDLLERACAAEGDGDESRWFAVQRTRVLKEWGWAAVQSHDWPRVLDIAVRLAAAGEDDDTVLMRGCGLIGVGRFLEAEELLRRAPVPAPGTAASLYNSVALARAILHQGRHDEAEQTLLQSLGRHCGDAADQGLISRHLEVLEELFQARGTPEKDRIAVEMLRRIRPGNPVLERFADEYAP